MLLHEELGNVSALGLQEPGDQGTRALAENFPSTKKILAFGNSRIKRRVSVDRAVSRGVNLSHIVICVPYLWYTKTLAGGTVGFNTGPNNVHWLLRAGIKRLAGIKGCRMVDLSEVMAAVQPADLAVVGRDPQVRDNLHPTLFSYRKIGHAIAREIMAGTGGARFVARLEPPELPETKLSAERANG